MYEFAYHKASSVADAASRLAAADEGVLLAGGMSLIPTLKMRLAMPTDVIDIRHLDEMKGIRVEGSTLSIGANTSHAEVLHSAEVKRAIPALVDLIGLVGDPQVRTRGTIGGSVANADPAADYPAAVVALNAKVVTDRREVAGEAFFTGLFETALEPGEIVTRIDFPIPKRAGYQKFPNPASRYAIVGVMVAETDAGVRVGVTGAGPSAFRATALEEALAKNFAPEALDGLTIPADDLNSDIHASAEYRAHLVVVMAKRAVKAAIG